MHITRRQMLAGAAAVGLAGSADAAKLPNIVFVTLDDLLSVWHDRTRYGPSIRTPNLNRLAARGMHFRNAFASVPICEPSRAGIVSGLGPLKTGVHTANKDGESSDWWDSLDPQNTWIAALRNAGYRCYMYGKITHDLGVPIWRQRGICSEQVDLYDYASKEPTDKRNVTLAIERMDALATTDRPWLLMLGLHDPHAPLTSPPEFLEPYPLKAILRDDWQGDVPAWRPDHVKKFEPYREDPERLARHQQAYLGNITEGDAQLGRFLDALDASGTDAYVLLTSDHSRSVGEHDMVGKDAPWDSSCRAPLIIAGPGIPAGLPYNDAVSLLDIAPTVLDLLDLPVPANMDGRSLLPALADPSSPRDYGALSSIQGESLTFRGTRWRVIRNINPAAPVEFELYDQVADPDSTDNLAASQPIKMNTMLARMDAEHRRWQGLA